MKDFKSYWFFILIWANDSFAYLVGRKFGKTKLAPILSPKKSVEGFIGGVVFSVLFAIVLHYFFPFIDLIHYVALAFICSVIGTMGDLFESKIKRHLGIKDSGTALGGHGWIFGQNGLNNSGFTSLFLLSVSFHSRITTKRLKKSNYLLFGC